MRPVSNLDHTGTSARQVQYFILTHSQPHNPASNTRQQPNKIVIPQRKIPACDWSKSSHVSSTNTHCWWSNCATHWSHQRFLFTFFLLVLKYNKTN